MLATVDILSNGRLIAGVGVGWMREEFAPLGAPPVTSRGAVTDEYLAAFRVLWTHKAPSFQGKHVRFDDVIFTPKPVQSRIPDLGRRGKPGRAAPYRALRRRLVSRLA